MAAPEIPLRQKAVIYDKPGTMSTNVTEIDVPEPGSGEVLINLYDLILTHSSVCHSDYSIMTTKWKVLPYPTQPGQISGHEGIGEVVKLRYIHQPPLVNAVQIELSGLIEPCEAGCEALGFSQKASAYYTASTFQQYTRAPANYVTPILDELASDEAAPTLCAGITAYSALKPRNARPGQWVAIPGAGGGLGHIAVQLASKGMGQRAIRVSGAEHFVDITRCPMDDDGAAISSHVMSLTGGLGVHAAVVCTCSNAAYAQALQFLRFNGTLVCVGVPENGPKPIASALPATKMGNHCTITGSAVGNRRDAIETLDFAALGIIKTHVRTGRMATLTGVFEAMEMGTLQGEAVLDLSG
ncbi:hypothetical protein BDV38DRAFT_274174 [Aspergillus pseudotamarii]|uniref:Chaperonin 10-like protein n=1 Tax=Aspergillus pseudotamarii TaxID=132259 RepID=A0A5N6SFU2_ASPPS|nr:uncharacterized protein BDV38DRAFT_274174 [Aspergillus pseudotamarii]KAE8133598.1 hypothetical protein BDV38DRAFT_274174 [Aspergillus pseudotamarii]